MPHLYYFLQLLFDPAVVDFEAKRAAIVKNPWGPPSVEEMDGYGDTIVRHAVSLVDAYIDGCIFCLQDGSYAAIYGALGDHARR